MPVYRYQANSISQTQISEQVPGAPVIGSTGPSIYVDVTVAAGSKPDLDEYMTSIGYSYVSQDPLTTPAQAASAQLLAGGSAGQVQYNNGGPFGGAAKLSIDAGGYPNLGEASTVNPAVPAAGSTIFAKYRAGRRMAAQISPNGVSYTLQPSLWGNKIGWWSALGNGLVVSAININNNTTGTATARNVATTTYATSLRQIAYVSAAGAGSSAGTRHGAAQFYTGDVAGRGGFFYVARFVIDTVAAGMRWFIGLLNGIAVIGNVNPSSQLNLVGFGIDAGQTTVRFMNNDGVGVATATDMGASFPATTAGAVYEVRIFCPPNGGTISYSIERLDSAALIEGSVSADIPANTTLLSPQMWINNGATAAAVALSVVTQYIETDN
jgi:hypothetical protein